MKGYDLMTEEQRQEWDSLEERLTHSSTMRFTDLDYENLRGYRDLATRLENEYKMEISE